MCMKIKLLLKMPNSIILLVLVIVLAKWTVAQNTSNPFSDQFYVGTAYYPEQSDESEWEKDAVLMQKAGVNFVRMGEFGWSKFEPKEGIYDFAWLDKAIAIMEAHGIKTMACTPSRTPPPWVFSKYPEIINTRLDGEHVEYGFRYTVNLNHPTFKKLSQKIDSLVVSHYAKNKAVVAWQIDNEIGAFNDDVSDVSEKAFQDYLKAKYGTIGNLNEKWGSHFWSLTYSEFADVKIPGRLANPELAKEWSEFCSKTNVDFALWRYKLIKKANTAQWVTTNFQETRTTHTDIMALGEATDVYGTNFYHRLDHEFSLDYCRGSRNELIILEQEASYTTSQVRSPKGLMRLNAYNSIAHGANGVCVFRWKPARWGQEKYWGGILPHDGQPNWLYDELSQFGNELKKVGAAINQTRPNAQVAILMDYQSRWASDSWMRRWNAMPEIEAYHDALMSQNLITDGLQPTADLKKYRLVIAPYLYVIDEQIAANIRDYVAGGGVFCMTRHSAAADPYNKIYNNPLPAFLTDVAGIEIHTFGKLEGELGLKSLLPEVNLNKATLWEDEIHLLENTQLVATYNDGWMKDASAITLHKYGKGYFVYVGTVPDKVGKEGLVHWMSELAGVRPVLDCPKGVRAFSRENSQYKILFLFNTTDQLQHIQIGQSSVNMLTGEIGDSFAIDSNSVSVIKLEKQ